MHGLHEAFACTTPDPDRPRPNYGQEEALEQGLILTAQVIVPAAAEFTVNNRRPSSARHGPAGRQKRWGQLLVSDVLDGAIDARNERIVTCGRCCVGVLVPRRPGRPARRRSAAVARHSTQSHRSTFRSGFPPPPGRCSGFLPLNGGRPGDFEQSDVFSTDGRDRGRGTSAGDLSVREVYALSAS